MTTPRESIVIVEDDSGLNQAMSRLLQAAGFEVTSFGSASAALLSDATRRAKCLVLDVHLSEMTGYELQRQLAESGHAPPVIVVTARDDASNRRQARSIGAVAYITKPFAGRTLVDEVTRVVGSAS